MKKTLTVISRWVFFPSARVLFMESSGDDGPGPIFSPALFLLAKDRSGVGSAGETLKKRLDFLFVIITKVSTHLIVHHQEFVASSMLIIPVLSIEFLCKNLEIRHIKITE